MWLWSRTMKRRRRKYEEFGPERSECYTLPTSFQYPGRHTSSSNLHRYLRLLTAPLTSLPNRMSRTHCGGGQQQLQTSLIRFCTLAACTVTRGLLLSASTESGLQDNNTMILFTHAVPLIFDDCLCQKRSHISLWFVL